MDNYNALELREHNKISYQKIVEQFEHDNIAAIVHATGTGKSYNALQLAYDNKDKNTTIIVPSIAAKNHILDIINENPKLNLDRDFPNLKIITYQSLITKRDKELSNLNIDYLVLDEFHHIGAPVWGEKVNKIVKTHPNMKVLGMTAYKVRDRGTSFERDMTNSKTEELFSGKVVSTYDLYDAILDGVLPLPQYISTNIDMVSDIENLNEEIENNTKISNEQKNEYLKAIRDCRDTIVHHPLAQELLYNNLQEGDKCIYFCPLHDGVIKNENGKFVDNNDVLAIQSVVSRALMQKDIITYMTTSDYGVTGIDDQYKFYNDMDHFNNIDVSDKLMIMFAKNQYNEAVHARRVNKVVLARRTNSDIVFFEQIGRALSIGGNTSPLIIDLAGNIEYIKELKDNLKDRLKERIVQGKSSSITKEMIEHNFKITIEYEDIIEILNDLRNRLSLPFEERLNEYLKAMQENNNNLISRNSKLLFSDGTKMGIFWNNNRDGIYQEIMTGKYDKEYSECVNTIKEAYQQYQEYKDLGITFEEKLNEYLKAMQENNNNLISHNSKLLFSDGTKMNFFWYFNRDNIYKEIITGKYNKEYLACVNTIKEAYQQYQENKDLRITFEEKINEYLKAMQKNNNNLISHNSKLLFSDGTQMSFFWNKKMNNIYQEIMTGKYDKEYLECVNTIKEAYYDYKITEKNQTKIKISMLENLKSILLNYDSNSLPDKEELNQEMMDKLSR